jgi:hypothetical protein
MGAVKNAFSASRSKPAGRNIQYAKIDAAGIGDNTLVAAVAGMKIRVLSLFAVMTGTAVTIRFESGASGTALTGQMQPTQGGGFVLPYNEGGWFETAAGELLNLELGGAQSVDGCLSYELVSA